MGSVTVGVGFFWVTQKTPLFYWGGVVCRPENPPHRAPTVTLGLLMHAQAMLGNTHPRLKLAHPQLRLKQQLFRSRDGNGKCYRNIPVRDGLL